MDSPLCSFNKQKAFTLIELVMTILLLGILAVSAMPRFFDITSFQQRGFFDETLNAMHYAQKLAIASGCNVQFRITANRYQLNRPAASNRSQCKSISTGDFSQNVIRPGSGESTYQGSQSGVSLSDVTLYFHAKGNASKDVSISVGARQITVIAATGFIYDSTP